MNFSNVTGQTGGLTAVALVFATVALTALPKTADARHDGAAIALGVLGGAVAGAAIASTVNPYPYGYGSSYYAAPAPTYYYAPQSYYPPATYYAPAPYYGSSYNPYYGSSNYGGY